MSGRKDSEIALLREKEEKLKAISKIKERRERLAGLARTLKNILQETPQGVKTTYEKEVKASLSWIEEIQKIKTDKVTMDLSQDILTGMLSTLENQITTGQNNFASITACLTKKADAMEESLYSKLAMLRCTFAGGHEPIKTWFGIDNANKTEMSLSKTGTLLRQKQLGEADRILADIEYTLHSQIKEAQALEYKQQKRMYVLKALRQVCTEMGFEESEPVFEKPGNRNRIIYEIDTFSQGKIRFYLSLDAISSESGIIESKCLDEFDKLSTSLEEEFGVKTKFRVEGEVPNERLIHKGEIDLPEGAQIEKNAEGF